MYYTSDHGIIKQLNNGGVLFQRNSDRHLTAVIDPAAIDRMRGGTQYTEIKTRSYVASHGKVIKKWSHEIINDVLKAFFIGESLIKNEHPDGKFYGIKYRFKSGGQTAYATQQLRTQEQQEAFENGGSYEAKDYQVFVERFDTQAEAEIFIGGKQ